jgi:hypothetical protein
MTSATVSKVPSGMLQGLMLNGSDIKLGAACRNCRTHSLTTERCAPTQLQGVSAWLHTAIAGRAVSRQGGGRAAAYKPDARIHLVVDSGEDVSLPMHALSTQMH